MVTDFTPSPPTGVGGGGGGVGVTVETLDQISGSNGGEVNNIYFRFKHLLRRWRMWWWTHKRRTAQVDKAAVVKTRSPGLMVDNGTANRGGDWQL